MSNFVPGSKKSTSETSKGNSLHKAYRRNGIILVISGLGIIISMLAGNMCVPTTKQNTPEKSELELAAALKEQFNDFLFDCAIVTNEKELHVEISVIRNDSDEITPALIAQIKKIVYSKVKSEQGSLIINFYLRLKNLQKEEIVAFEKRYQCSFTNICEDNTIN